MPRPIWKGDISFGLVTIPVSLVPVEHKNDVQFHLLDSRDKSRVRYHRINEDTGKEVPWDKIVKGYEFEKNQYVVLKDDDFQKASPEAFKSIDIEEFVNLKEIDTLFFEKPYYLLPEGKNKKAYVLLREALKKTGKVGVAKVIIRTREFLSLIMAHDHALMLNLIRYHDEIREESELNLPVEPVKHYKIVEREIKMAMDLIKEMSAEWNPDKYHDEYRKALMQWIEDKTLGKGKIQSIKTKKETRKDDVVDFISLLKNSIQKKKPLKKKI